MRHAIVVCGFVLGASLSSVASAQSISYGPILGRGVTPDQMIVKWGTGSAADSTSVSYRPKGSTAPFTTVTGAAAKDHEVVLTGLTLDSQFEYYVSSGAAKSATYALATCPMPGAPMDVVFYGDSRDGASEHQKIVNQVIARAPEMVFESGDLYVSGTYAGYLQEFFPVTKSLIATTPFMAVPGNHDASSTLSTNYGLVFPSPRPAGAAWQPYYAFTCGNAMFIGLNSNSTGDSTQNAFLANKLQEAHNNTDVAHVFIWFHHSAYSPGQHGDDKSVQSAWVPVIEAEPKVTAVFSGHDHIYARLTHGSAKIAYVVSGGAGAPLYTANGSTAATVVMGTNQSLNNFTLVHIAGAVATGTAYNDSGMPIDSFTVTQSTSGGSGGGGGSDGGSDAGGSGGASDGGVGGDGPGSAAPGDHAGVGGGPTGGTGGVMSAGSSGCAMSGGHTAPMGTLVLIALFGAAVLVRRRPA
jgi:hypothetical protein